MVDIEDENGETTTTDIREAFVDDDVITEFRRDKKRQVEDDKPKVIDLILPGFDGEWAGEDFKVSQNSRPDFGRLRTSVGVPIKLHSAIETSKTSIPKATETGSPGR